MANQDPFDAAMHARGGTAAAESAELRQETPRWILDVLDALSLAEGESRTAYVNKVLERHARSELHRASMLRKVAGRNPIVSDLIGGQPA
jgi:hypothetical protein